jgi:protein translocase SecG subunit
LNERFLTIVLAVQMLSALGMIGLILIQHGKGADMGAAFGSGGSGSLFGASGSANFLSRTTAVLAAVFFVCTLRWPTLAICAHELRQRAGRRCIVAPAPARRCGFWRSADPWLQQRPATAAAGCARRCARDARIRCGPDSDQVVHA